MEFSLPEKIVLELKLLLVILPSCHTLVVIDDAPTSKSMKNNIEIVNADGFVGEDGIQ